MRPLFTLGSRILPALWVAMLTACTAPAPQCPVVQTQSFAPSAGCLALQGRQILVVENSLGKVSPPGGGSREGESAQCTAHRETWEETGLNLQPQELLRTFDTGFHLYRCEILPASGELNPVDTWEVSKAYWLSVEDFDLVQWRYPDQGRQLREFIPH